jgi:hypothetical protein
VEKLTYKCKYAFRSTRGDSIDICRDWVEKGFCSASTKKAVALHYAGTTKCKSCGEKGRCEFWDQENGICREHRATVLEIEMGEMDRGADLRWVSQWPNDEESVIPPLSNFEVKGMRREDNINFLRVGLRSNFHTQTLEQTRTSRQAHFTCIVQELKQETEQLLHDVRDVIDFSIFNAMFTKITKNIIDEASRYMMTHQLPDLAEYFNAPGRFGSVINTLMKNWSIMMADIARKLVEVIQPLMFDLSEHNQVNVSDSKEEMAAAEYFDDKKERLQFKESAPSTLPDDAMTQRHQQEAERLKLEIERLLTTALHIAKVMELAAAEREDDACQHSKQVLNIVYDLQIYFSSRSCSAEALASL